MQLRHVSLLPFLLVATATGTPALLPLPPPPPPPASTCSGVLHNTALGGHNIRDYLDRSMNVTRCCTTCDRTPGATRTRPMTPNGAPARPRARMLRGGGGGAQGARPRKATEGDATAGPPSRCRWSSCPLPWCLSLGRLHRVDARRAPLQVHPEGQGGQPAQQLPRLHIGVTEASTDAAGTRAAAAAAEAAAEAAAHPPRASARAAAARR